jgi:hypothetical protein
MIHQIAGENGAMNTISKWLMTAALLVSFTEARADFLYTYSGNAFQANYLPGATDIIVDFYSPTILAANTIYESTSAIFSTMTVSDGVDTITPGNGTFNTASFVATDGSGNIFAWEIPELAGANRSFFTPGECCSPSNGDFPVLYTYNPQGLKGVSGATDATIQNASFSPDVGGIAYNNQEPGIWSVSAVPLPTTAWLLLSGLAGVAWSGRGRRLTSALAASAP